MNKTSNIKQLIQTIKKLDDLEVLMTILSHCEKRIFTIRSLNKYLDKKIDDYNSTKNLRVSINMESGKFEKVVYEPTCRFGEYDCVCDPAYCHATYPESYAKDENPMCNECNYGDAYDDEDK